MTLKEFKEITGIKSRIKIDDIILFDRDLYRYEKIPYSRNTQIRKINREKLTDDEISKEISSNTIAVQIYIP